jgi:hypothetical protein
MLMEPAELLRLDKELHVSERRRLLQISVALITTCGLMYWLAHRFTSPAVFSWVQAGTLAIAFLQIVVALICATAEVLGFHVDYGLGLGPTPGGRIFISRLKDRSRR